jgi:hypothetical protein
MPHIPPGISRLEQKFPIRFGAKRLYLSVIGQGPITRVIVNGQPWRSFDAQSVGLPYAGTPATAAIHIVRGEAKAAPVPLAPPDDRVPTLPALSAWPEPKTMPVIATNELPLRLGADSNGGSRFQGDFARACVFRRALSAPEIAALVQADAGARPRDPAGLACWAFTPSADGTFANLSGPLPAARVVGKVETTNSPFGPALRLTGEGYLEVPNSPAIDLAKGATFYALVRPGTTQGRLIDKCPVGGATGFTFDTHPGNALRLISDSGAISFDAKLTPGEWVHVAATVDEQGNSALYLNGKQVTRARRGTGTLSLENLLVKTERLRRFHAAMLEAGLGETYEAAHARLAVRYLATAYRRAEMLAAGQLARLPERSQAAADRLYLDTAAKLCDGLEKVLNRHAQAQEALKRRIHTLWKETG